MAADVVILPLIMRSCRRAVLGRAGDDLVLRRRHRRQANGSCERHGSGSKRESLHKSSPKSRSASRGWRTEKQDSLDVATNLCSDKRDLLSFE